MRLLLLALLLAASGCRCGAPPLIAIEDCDNGIDDDENGDTDCDDSICLGERYCRKIDDDAGTPDAGPPDAGVPDAGSDAGVVPDAGTVTYSNACPGLSYTPVCGTPAGSAWRKVVPRATEGLFTSVWVASDGGSDVFAGGTSVHRWNGATLTNDIPDAGVVLYVTRVDGSAANDLWLMTAEASDGTRLLHRTDAGWRLVAHDRNFFSNDLAFVNKEPWLLLPNKVGRPSDGGFVSWPLPPDTNALFLSAEPNGELWIGGYANPCPGFPDGGVCPRVVHGRPGEWAVDDWPCRLGNGAAHVWRRTPNEQVVTGGGFISRRIDGGWTQPEATTFSGARMSGTANDAWMAAYDLFIGSQSSGVAHFNGCVESPVYLYTTRLPTNPANGIVYSVAVGGASSWAATASWNNTLMKWQGELWTYP